MRTCSHLDCSSVLLFLRLFFQMVWATLRARIERKPGCSWHLPCASTCFLRDKQDVRGIIPLESHKERGKNQQGGCEDRTALCKSPRSSIAVPNSRLTFLILWTFRAHGKTALVCEIDNCTVHCMKSSSWFCSASTLNRHETTSSLAEKPIQVALNLSHPYL